MTGEAYEDIKVSIVMPFYNRIGWTLEAIDSGLKQTHRNIELIAIDDGSTDDVTAVHRIGDPRLRYERIEKAGIGPARNRGVQLATGKYVAFLDSDDLFLPDKIEQQIAFMEAGGHRFSHTSYERFFMHRPADEVVRSGRLSGSVLRTLIVSCPVATPTVMLRRDLALANPFPSAQAGEDIITWLAVAERHDLAGLDAPLTRVRISNGTTAINRDKLSIGMMSVASYVLSRHGEQYSDEVGELLRNLARLYPEPGNGLEAQPTPPTVPDAPPTASRQPASRLREYVHAFIWYTKNLGLAAALAKTGRVLVRSTVRPATERKELR